MRPLKVILLMTSGLILGFLACWSLAYFFKVEPSTHGLFYYQKRHPYEKNLGKDEIATMDSLTVIFRQILYYTYNSYYRDISLEDIAVDLFKRRNTALDPHSSYWTPQEVTSQYEVLLNRDFSGIGIKMMGERSDSSSEEKAKVTVNFVFPKTPAEHAGVLKRDTIITVDGKKVFSTGQAKKLIRGETGTKVLLEILRPAHKEVLRFNIERNKIVVPSVTWDLIDKDKLIGLVKIHSFAMFEPLNLQLALTSLKGLGVKDVVLDLSDDSGGFVESFLHSSYLFMSKNDTIAVSVSRESKTIYDSLYVVREFGKSNFGRFKDLRIVCIVNGNTASAAEFFAKTMQRWGYVLVGEPTAGYSTMLKPFVLMGGSRINIASQKTYFGGRQEEIPATGVRPDILVVSPLIYNYDLQLEKAIEILQKGDKK
ncbi:MAG: S41 family peptidase [bacterium]|nr:S41 family peptidase [bacterium]